MPSNLLTPERLGRIVEEAASEVYVFSGHDYRFRVVNRGARENLGYAPGEIARLTPWDLKPLISEAEFRQMVQPLLDGRIDKLRFETVHRRKDGSDYDVLVSLQYFGDGPDPVFYASIIDVTEQARTARLLAQTALRLDSILANTEMAIFLMDDRQQCVFMNRAAEELTGFTLADMTGRPLHDVIHHTRPDGSPFALEDCPIDRAFPERVGVKGEEVFVHRDGSFYPVAFTASPIYGENADVVGTVIEARNISAEKRAEAMRQLLMREVDHRSRNVLAVAQSLAKLTRGDDIGSYKRALDGRLAALARAQTSLASRRWEGGSVGDVVRREIEALCPAERCTVTGPDIWLCAAQVQPLSMLLHELATNANKYGALAVTDGRVSVTWRRCGEAVELVWDEADGPATQPPGRQGFGTVLQDSLAGQLNGALNREWRASGLRIALSFPCAAGDGTDVAPWLAPAAP